MKGACRKIVLLKSLEIVKEQSKFYVNSNSNKMMFSGGVGGNIILFQIRFERNNLIFYVSLPFLSEF